MSEPATLAYDRLRSQILDLERVPGSRLTERGLEGELGASRTPLRAALMRLEAEGLVVRHGRAWEIAPIDLGEISRLSELRAALETAAVRLSSVRADPAALESLAARVTRFDRARNTEEAVRAGARFHVELAALSGNHFFADAIDGAMTRLARARWLVASDPGAWEEHRDIVALVAAHDAEGAAELLDRHVVATHERLLDALDADARSLRARGLAVVR